MQYHWESQSVSYSCSSDKSENGSSTVADWKKKKKKSEHGNIDLGSPNNKSELLILTIHKRQGKTDGAV